MPRRSRRIPVAGSGAVVASRPVAESGRSRASLTGASNPAGGRGAVFGRPPAQRMVIDGFVDAAPALTVRDPATGPNLTVTAVRPRLFVTVLPALMPSLPERPESDQLTTWLPTGLPFFVLTTRALTVAVRLQRTTLGPERMTWIWVCSM